MGKYKYLIFWIGIYFILLGVAMWNAPESADLAYFRGLVAGIILTLLLRRKSKPVNGLTPE